MCLSLLFYIKDVNYKLRLKKVREKQTRGEGKGIFSSSLLFSATPPRKYPRLGTVRYLCLRGGRCLEWGGGKIFKINEKGGVFF